MTAVSEDRLFNLNYELIIIDGQTERQITIKPPLTLTFNVARHLSTDCNTGNFTLYGLSENTRNFLRQDKFNAAINNGAVPYRKQIILKANCQQYGNNLYPAFIGNIVECYSFYNGNSIVTSIEAFDGWYGSWNSYSNFTQNAGTPTQEVLKALVKDITTNGKGVTMGTIDDFDGNFPRGISVHSNTYSLLTEAKIVDADAFIDLGDINVIKKNSYLKKDKPVFDKAIKALTPKDNWISFETLLYTQVQIGAPLKLASRINKHLNGTYRVDTIEHSGTIAGDGSGQGSNATTKIELNRFVKIPD